MPRPGPLPAMFLVFPRSLFKAVTLCAFIGLIAGWSYFLVAGWSVVHTPPIGTLWVMLSSVGCGLFASLASAWGWMACLNRENRKVFFYFLTIALLLTLVVLSFWVGILTP